MIVHKQKQEGNGDFDGEREQKMQGIMARAFGAPFAGPSQSFERGERRKKKLKKNNKIKIKIRE